MSCIDTSAIVAILSNEPDRPRFLSAIEQGASIISVASVFEACIVLSSKFGSCSAALVEIQRLLTEAEITIVSIAPDSLFELALTYDRFGKGIHPARLNLGDCFTYVTAKRYGVPIIYKGDDFARTDLG